MDVSPQWLPVDPEGPERAGEREPSSGIERLEAGLGMRRKAPSRWATAPLPASWNSPHRKNVGGPEWPTSRDGRTDAKPGNNPSEFPALPAAAAGAPPGSFVRPQFAPAHPLAGRSPARVEHAGDIAIPPRLR